MTDQQQDWTPPQVWRWEQESGGRFANINRPISGATHDKVLPAGRHPLQLYSLGTPNGVKITIMLEELLALGHNGAEYDAHLVRIDQGDQFGSGFVALNPNSKIPVMLDNSVTPAQPVFESGAILLYLAEKFSSLIPSNLAARTRCLSWLFWQMGSAPYAGGGFGHFYRYAPTKIEYCVNRFTMELKRQLDVLDHHLADNEYLDGEGYSIADIAVWPWYGQIVRDVVYQAAEFLDAASYENVNRWAAQLAERPAVLRGTMVNRVSGPLHLQLHERHDASDFEHRTQDKLAAVNDTGES